MPWSAFWERNYFVESLPFLQDLLKNNFVRGAVSGLGLVNLAIGFIDLASVMSTRHLVESMSGPDPNTVSRLVNED